MSNYIYKDGELYHHGVKGMRWGHRKDNDDRSSRPSSGSSGKESDSSMGKKFNRKSNSYSTNGQSSGKGSLDYSRNESNDSTVNKIKTALSTSTKKQSNQGNKPNTNQSNQGNKPNNNQNNPNNQTNKPNNQNNQTNKPNNQNPTNSKKAHNFDADIAVARSSKDVLAVGSNVNKMIAKSKNDKKVQAELDQMSNQELQQRVNRLNLEQQYRNYTKDDMSKGHARIETILAVGSTLASVAMTGLTIAKMIQDLKKKTP